MDEIDVVCGVYCRDGKYLLQQRSSTRDFPLHWEFPGGKVEVGEAFDAALVREWQEELGVRPVVGNQIAAFVFEPPVVPRRTILRACWVQLPDGAEPKALDAEQIGFFSLEEAARLQGTPAQPRIYEMISKYLFLAGDDFAAVGAQGGIAGYNRRRCKTRLLSFLMRRPYYAGGRVWLSHNVFRPESEPVLALGELPSTIKPSREGTFYAFIDLEPDCNWAHRCVYLAMHHDGADLHEEAEWPPEHLSRDFLPVDATSLIDSIAQVKGGLENLAKAYPGPTFSVDGIEAAKGKLAWYKHFAASHPDQKTGAIGGGLSWVFTPTSLGTIVKMVCACGWEHNVTNWDEFS